MKTAYINVPANIIHNSQQNNPNYSCNEWINKSYYAMRDYLIIKEKSNGIWYMNQY